MATTDLPLARREALIIELGDAMSELSEECYCAGWLIGCEDEIPALCRRALDAGTDQPWGMGYVTVETATRLTAMADQLGHWACWGSALGYDAHTP